jgi:hypothetical protein
VSIAVPIVIYGLMPHLHRLRLRLLARGAAGAALLTVPTAHHRRITGASPAERHPADLEFLQRNAIALPNRESLWRSPTASSAFRSRRQTTVGYSCPARRPCCCHTRRVPRESAVDTAFL